MIRLFRVTNKEKNPIVVHVHLKNILNINYKNKYYYFKILLEDFKPIFNTFLNHELCSLIVL